MRGKTHVAQYPQDEIKMLSLRDHPAEIIQPIIKPDEEVSLATG